jgi:hypothetical protein
MQLNIQLPHTVSTRYDKDCWGVVHRW